MAAFTSFAIPAPARDKPLSIQGFRIIFRVNPKDFPGLCPAPVQESGRDLALAGQLRLEPSQLLPGGLAAELDGQPFSDRQVRAGRVRPVELLRRGPDDDIRPPEPLAGPGARPAMLVRPDPTAAPGTPLMNPLPARTPEARLAVLATHRGDIVGGHMRGATVVHKVRIGRIVASGWGSMRQGEAPFSPRRPASAGSRGGRSRRRTRCHRQSADRRPPPAPARTNRPTAGRWPTGGTSRAAGPAWDSFRLPPQRPCVARTRKSTRPSPLTHGGVR
jgi:hypothetical protein